MVNGLTLVVWMFNCNGKEQNQKNKNEMLETFHQRMCLRGVVCWWRKWKDLEKLQIEDQHTTILASLKNTSYGYQFVWQYETPRRIASDAIEFQASKGWFDSFRACLHNIKLAGESVGANEEAVQEVFTKFVGITEEGVILNTSFLMLMWWDYFGKRYSTWQRLRYEHWV